MNTTPTTTAITPNVRLSARNTLNRMRYASQDVLADAVYDAAQAEAFPESYTEHAVKVAEQMIVAAAAWDWSKIEALAVEVAYLQETEMWFAPRHYGVMRLGR